MFKGTAPCGCVTWLYSARHDTPKQQVAAIAEVLRDGITVTPILNEEERIAANQAWGTCPHQAPVMTWKQAREKAADTLRDVGP